MVLFSNIKSVMHKIVASCTLLLVSIAVTQPVFALEFECSVGNDKRFIRLELPGIEHLCEVTVTNGADERKVMWYANHDSMFCSEKTTELKDKYIDKWNFQCDQWPDHDGVDQLNTRQRTILDAELKLLIDQGKTAANPFMVEGLKAAASPTQDNQNSLLVVQFFLHEPSTSATRDVTHVIRDDGLSWNTQVRLDTLSNYVDANEGYIVNSALISTVTDNGAMEIITVLDSTAPDTNSASPTEGCYGNQTLAAQSDGQLVARTPHRYVCQNSIGGDAG